MPLVRIQSHGPTAREAVTWLCASGRKKKESGVIGQLTVSAMENKHLVISVSMAENRLSLPHSSIWQGILQTYQGVSNPQHQKR